MPNAADKLHDDYVKALTRLQATCKHELGEPGEYYWAPAHSAGQRRWCIHCNKMFKVNGEVE